MSSGWSKNCVFFLALGTFGAVPALAAVRDGVPAVDDSLRISVARSVPPRIAGLTASGRVDATLSLENMMLVLKMGTQNRARLDQLLRDQQDPTSASYHQWLTPESFGASFGPSAAQVAAASTWLASHGLTVRGVAKSGLAITFSGSAGQVEEAFQTTLKTYQVDGVTHHANASSVTIPQGLSGFVQGVASLHDFRHQPHHTLPRPVTGAALSHPMADLGSYGNFLGAVDLATIYDITPTYASYTGAGVTIGLVERTDIDTADFTTFQELQDPSRYTGSLTVSHNGADPGVVAADEMEAELDTQWAAAAAPGATLLMAVSASSYTTDGVDLSAQYLVENNLAQVISVSYGSAESGMGSDNSFYDQLWAQAAAQGISVFVATGDEGATQGGGVAAVNGLASPPYATAVGGTMFHEGGITSYWGVANGTGTYPATATGYIPEWVWNESGVGASGGGVSILYAKPSWQFGDGLAAGGMRELPDVALDAAADHDPYLAVMNGTLYGVGGTSVAAPIMAGIAALAVQNLRVSLGNAGPALYTLARSNSSAFHDITSGNNTYGGVSRFAGIGYDMCTGLGSPEATILVNAIAGGSSVVTVTLAAPTSTQTIPSGTQVAFRGSATDSTGTGLTYTWDYGDGTRVTGATAGATYYHTYTNTTGANVTNLATLTASDGSYAGGKSVSILVQPNPMSVTITLPVTNVGVLPGIPITFTATVAPASNKSVTSSTWNFGDGSTASGLSATHTFSENASSVYTVTFSATDSGGNAASASLQVVADLASVMDANSEGAVDVRGLLRIAASWSKTKVASDTNLDGVTIASDLNADGKVDDTDLNLWMEDFVPVVE
jgi:subtilase family serine protease